MITTKHGLVNYDKDGDYINEEEIKVYVKTEKRHFKKGEFFIMRKDFLFEAIETYELKLLEIKVLSYFFKTIGFNNKIESFNQKLLAEKINSTQPRISEVLKTLTLHQIIYKDGLDWYFNDEFIKFAGDKK